ncbi:MAG TPA: aminotransferase class I/II-fold pyridoxal phosphate-dependent enzyme [Candidatus Cybelea sp.]|nr:aminotransferase class I/II-fold pyridoxal phosphate-dependent enzyme [Candidatus Cybelea sp.]
MTYLQEAERALEAICGEHRYRELPQHGLSDVIDFSSNDYLGLARDPQVVEALKRANRVGSGGARLLSGRHRELALLEDELADWLGRERVLLFSSGYLAGVGTIPVLAELVESILSDQSNHACLIDGIRLARKPHSIYAHAALPPVGGSKSSLVVSESTFSMEGDAVDPAALLGRLREQDVLLLDEAHALGVAGPLGAGFARALDDPRVLVLGTLSKALGSLGGFVAGPATAIELLVNRARSFIFDTALPPSLALASRIALFLTRRGDDRRERLRANAARLRAALPPGLAPTPGHVILSAVEGPIVSIVLGSEQRALRVSEELLKHRIFVPAIRPPTVPPGTSRLRITIRADHTLEQMDMLADELRRCVAIS